MRYVQPELDHPEKLLHAFVEELSDLAAGDDERLSGCGSRDRDLPGHADQFRRRAAVFDLEPLRLVVVCGEGHCQVVRELVAAHGYDRGVNDRSVVEHGDVRGPAAHIRQHDASVAFVGGQHRIGAADRPDDCLRRGHSGRGDGAPEGFDVLDDAGDDVTLDVEFPRVHPERVPDAVDAVERVAAGDHVQQQAVIGDPDA